MAGRRLFGREAQLEVVTRLVQDLRRSRGELLLLARLDRERPLTLAPVELPVLAMDAVQAAQATAPDRRIDLEVRDSPERLVAYADDGRLRQVIGNLMTNALVHTPPDAEVTLRLYAGDGDRAVIEVSDTGGGFDLTALRAGHGLDSLVRRLDTLFSEKARLNVTRRDGRCVVHMVLPRS